MFRFIVVIVVFLFFIGFIGFNLNNTCNISLLGIKVFHDVPVFLTSLCSFTLGILFALPLAFIRHKKVLHEYKQSPEEPKPQKVKKFNLLKKKETGTEPLVPADQEKIKKEDSPYGID